MVPSACSTSEAERPMSEGLVVVAVGIEVVWVRVLYFDTLAFTVCFLDYDIIIILHLLRLFVLTKLGLTVSAGQWTFWLGQLGLIFYLS